MKISRLDKPISHWSDNKKANVFYVLYQSFTTWDKTLLGVIKLHEESLDIYNGESKEGREFISSFMTEAYSPISVRYLYVGDSYNNHQIKKHLHDIVTNISNDNSQNNMVKQLLLHIESDNYQYTYTDVKGISAEEIAKLMEQHRYMYFKSENLNKSFYCGITNDVDIRMDQHRRDDFPIEDDHVRAYVCANVEVAKQVEGLLGIKGYDIGGQNAAGNGAVKTSCVVYFLKKGVLI